MCLKPVRAIVVCGLVCAIVGSRGDQVLARLQGPSPARTPRLVIDLRPTADAVRGTLLQLSSMTRTPLAIELVTGSAGVITRTEGSGGQSERDDFVYDLTGLPVGEAGERIAQLTQARNSRVIPYEWRLDRGVYHFAARNFINNRAVALGKRLAHFEARPASVLEALVAIHQSLDAQYPRHPLASPQRMPDRVRPLYFKSLTISLDNATVRDCLDEIIRQHGSLSWLAEYSDFGGGYAGLRLLMAGFDGWSVATHAEQR